MGVLWMLAETLAAAASVVLTELLDVNLFCKFLGVVAVPSLVVMGAKRMGLPYFDTSLDSGEQRRATPKEVLKNNPSSPTIALSGPRSKIVRMWKSLYKPPPASCCMFRLFFRCLLFSPISS